MNKITDIETNIRAEQKPLQIQASPDLSAIIPSQMARDEIYTSNAVYESAHGILSRGMNEDSARVLSFLSASLRAASRASGSGSTRQCAARARQLLRCSGCLQDMLDMLLSTTPLNTEDWKLVCECLAESCKDCYNNQLHCFSLIPICIQRLNEGNNESISTKLLHSLLLNNKNNINIFVECNGTSIFTKDTIHDSAKMELLSVVAENASAADIIKRDSDLVNSLITVGEDYKVNCQESWKMVEWASVILFHLASRVEGTILNISDFDLDMNGSETTLHDLSVSFLMKPKWEKVGPSQLFYNDTIKNKKGDHESKCAVMDFAPTFASTPKKRISTTRGTELSKELKDRTQQKNDNISKEPCENNSASRLKKTLSTRTRLLQMVNNSCVSVCKTMGTIFCREPADTQSRRLLKQKFNIDEGNVIKFTEYLKQKISHTDKKTSSNLSSQKNAKKKLKLVIKQKFLKNIVRKLKTGMHFYGCNFKKIAQEMWLHEEEMTPKVLYNIYRKYILK